MKNEKKFLGNIGGKPVYLYKHQRNEFNGNFNFGSITLHENYDYLNIRELIEDKRYSYVYKIFNTTPHSFDTWCRLIELFHVAYEISAVIHVYHNNCHELQDYTLGIESINEFNEKLHNDLEKVLNKIWSMIP